MTLHVVNGEKVEPQPWRNGGGHTRELLAWPTASDWSLRISVADIDRNGPFSPYPGVERWFAVLKGAGVVLGLADGARRVDAGSAPLHFAGEDAPGCELLDGPTRDLNLMCRRQRGRASLQRAEPGVDFHAPATWRGLFCADAVMLQIDDGDARALAPFTLLWCEDGTPGRWRLQCDIVRPCALWLSFDAANAPAARVANTAACGTGAG